MKRRNVIYERARFNLRKQEEGETVAAFINDLYVLVEHCEYGVLQDEMVKDRLVVGLHDSKLSEKLQLDPSLTLYAAVMIHINPSQFICNKHNCGKKTKKIINCW